MNTSDKDAEFWIDNLQLIRHPEGGYFKEIYRSGESIDHLPERYSGRRSFATSIYFLLKGGECSRLHRLRSDEVWHFYAGSSLRIHLITRDGEYRILRLGKEFASGERFQAVIPAESWFGATVNEQHSFSLVGCAVAPGFDFDDFEMGDRRKLVGLFPQHRAIIEMLTPE